MTGYIPNTQGRGQRYITLHLHHGLGSHCVTLGMLLEYQSTIEGARSTNLICAKHGNLRPAASSLAMAGSACAHNA
jgi:hypothetical protein